MNWLLPAAIALTNEIPAPIKDKTTAIFGWVTSLLTWGAGIAFIVVGGIFCYSYFGGHGSSKAVRALAGVSVGCILVGAGSGLSKLLL